jgi:HD-GYP domain-containing protein (c-di-GMP phosphodiesterase class II)
VTNEYYKQLSQWGEALVKAIGGLTQIARMHLDNNALLVDAATKFISLIGQMDQKEEDVSIVHSDGRLYFQEKKLYIRPENKRMFNRMLLYLENRSIYSLHFKSNLNGVSDGAIIAFARFLDQADKHSEPSEWLKIQLEENKFDWVDINKMSVEQFSDPNLPSDEISRQDEWVVKTAQARKHYAHVLGSVKEVSRKLSSDGNAGMRNVVRLVQKMVDLVTEDDSLFSILGTVRIYDDYTYVHSLNVAILSMCLGKQIGLDHIMLERLGLCGLFHDLGKVEIPKQILNKRSRLSDDELSEIKSHPIHSVRLILKLKAGRDRKVKLLMAPFEHHMGFNRSGYPKLKNDHGISLFGRILTIADVYDAITSPRIYRAQTLSPDKALGYMLEQSGTTFDPILLKVFINMLGAYPVGTLLKFDTGEMGIVIGQSAGSDKTRPRVQLLVADPVERYKKGAIVDLAKQDKHTGKYRRTITESMHPADMRIQATQFLL